MGQRLLPLAAVFMIAGAWQLVAVLYAKPLVLPSLTDTVEEFFVVCGERGFWHGVGNTLARSVISFVAAFAGAFILALASQGSRVFAKLFYPVVVLLRALPTIAVIFICYIAVTGWYRAVIISFIVIFPTLYSSFCTAFEGCKGELMEVARVYGVKRRHVVSKYIVPAVWNGMYSDAVNTLSLTVKLVIAAEAITSTGISLGGLMKDYQQLFDMGRIFAYTLAAILLSYAAELFVRLICRIIKEIAIRCRIH